MKYILLALTLFASMGCASQQTPGSAIDTAQALADMQRAERGFAHASMTLGITPSFQAYVAPDGIIFRPGPVPAVETLASDVDEPGDTLDWWPSYGGVAASADLGYSAGPWQYTRANGRSFYGYYVTVWRRQADGAWKFVLDGGGARLNAAPEFSRASAIVVIPASIALSASGETAQRAEDRLHGELANSDASIVFGFLAENALVTGSGAEPHPISAAAQAELSRRPGHLNYTRLGGGASQAGDVVYTYGQVQNGEAGAAFSGHYVRVWQRRAEGWRIVIDALTPDA